MNAAGAMRWRLIVMAKAPVAGQVKTRLIPALGAEGAAALAARLLAHTIEQAEAAAPAQRELCVAPDPAHPAFADWAGRPGWRWSAQGTGDLGARMDRALTRALADFARQISLGAYLRVGKGEHASGGRQRPAILADAFESLVGAVLIDRGFTVAESLVLRFIVPELERVQRRQRSKDAKSRFQELSQKRWQLTPSYATVETSGPDHELSFVVEARVAGRTLGVGHGRSKAIAAQMAAEAALDTAAHIDHPNEIEVSDPGDG